MTLDCLNRPNALAYLRGRARLLDLGDRAIRPTRPA